MHAGRLTGGIAKEDPALDRATGEYPARDQVAGEDPVRRDLPEGNCVLGGVGDSSPSQVSAGVGEVVGKYAHFLTGEQVRELALVPGSSVYRILFDPVTGRYVERSTRAYRFDAAMRAHIRFADVRCRAPGCTVSAWRCQLDHVQEFGTPGGGTRESNGALLHAGHHQAKTEGWWDAVIHPNRDITWTTLLGRIYSTKAHDYRQYTQLLSAAIATVEQADLGDRDAAADRVIYAA